MDIHDVPCTVAALIEEERIVEVRWNPIGKNPFFGNIYLGQVENIASNIQAAFVQIGPGKRCVTTPCGSPELFFPQEEKETAHCGREMNFLVQVSRDAMKGKLPALDV